VGGRKKGREGGKEGRKKPKKKPIAYSTTIINSNILSQFMQVPSPSFLE
jgi:hypothetical protein